VARCKGTITTSWEIQRKCRDRSCQQRQSDTAIVVTFPLFVFKSMIFVHPCESIIVYPHPLSGHSCGHFYVEEHSQCHWAQFKKVWHNRFFQEFLYPTCSLKTPRVFLNFYQAPVPEHTDGCMLEGVTGEVCVAAPDEMIVDWALRCPLGQPLRCVQRWHGRPK